MNNTPEPTSEANTTPHFTPYGGSVERSDALLRVAGWLQRNSNITLDDCTADEVSRMVDLYIARGEEGMWSIYE